MSKYKTALLDSASKLDALTEACGEITKLASEIVENSNDTVTISLLRKISEIVSNQKYKIEIKRVAQTLKSNLIEYYGYYALKKICEPDVEIPEDSRSLTDLMNELNNLVGLKNVKAKVNQLIAFQKVQKLRRENNLHSVKNTLHLAFTGNPGTGKTTVARIVGHIYKQLGMLSKGHFVEVSRTDLIAGYQGQTALKVKSVIEKAKGGVLFIDEAYSITENDNSDSYGKECLTELTKALEDYRDDLVAIVAGYTEPMKKFFESNPGLKSRFNTFIEFPDYEVEDLEKILLSMCENNDYILDHDTNFKVHEYLKDSVDKKEGNFANGRLIRNLYDDLVMNHAQRVSEFKNPTRENLCTIKIDDFKIK